jgi:putative membrane protein
MSLLAQILVGIVAVLHLGFAILEMFLWNTPRGRASFGTTAAFAAQSATLAANQGLYNGFLAAGLIWGLVAADPAGFQAKVFFLACVIVAGLYGAATVNKRILFIQAFPAALAMAAVLLSR